MKPFMRLVLDEMPEDPDPITPSTQGTFVGLDGAGNLMMSWDDGRQLNLLPDADKWHVVGTTPSAEQNELELKTSFSQLKKVQDELAAGETSRCPRCGSQFDVRRGAISRRIDGVAVCDLCGQQEAIEDFMRDQADLKPISDWYIVKVWQGR